MAVSTFSNDLAGLALSFTNSFDTGFLDCSSFITLLLALQCDSFSVFFGSLISTLFIEWLTLIMKRHTVKKHIVEVCNYLLCISFLIMTIRALICIVRIKHGQHLAVQDIELGSSDCEMTNKKAHPKEMAQSVTSPFKSQFLKPATYSSSRYYQSFQNLSFLDFVFTFFLILLSKYVDRGLVKLAFMTSVYGSASVFFGSLVSYAVLTALVVLCAQWLRNKLSLRMILSMILAISSVYFIVTFILIYCQLHWIKITELPDF